MKRLLLLLVARLLLCPVSYGQRADNYPPNNTSVSITHTNLPIVWIEVGGAMILRDERITARMKIIHNGDGQLNYADTIAHPGQHIDYEGYIALRYRGHSSFYRSRKPYSFRPLDKPLEEGGEKKKVKILGMGKDNNWALLAPYSDQSLLRNPLAFELARPWMEYSPRSRFCEMYLDGIYYGVFILTEVVPKGKQRLNLPDPGESGDDITGGYIVEVDRYEQNCYTSRYRPVSSTGSPYSNKRVYFQYSWPDYEDLTENQLAYINGQVDQMETALWNYNPGGEPTYRQYLDVENFIDYQLAEELGHNVDAYSLSGKLYKRRDSEDPRFKMVVWDMDLAYGVPYYHEAWSPEKWSYELNDTLNQSGETYLVPFWWYRLNQDPDYVARLKARWAQYRRNNVREDRVMALVDSLYQVLTADGAVNRNSQAWPRWGLYVWPNHYTAQNYDDAIAYLKQWLRERIAWMDEQLGYDPSAVILGDVDDDGEVTINDVTALIDELLSVNAQSINLAAADVNQDRNVTIDDVTELIDMLLGN